MCSVLNVFIGLHWNVNEFTIEYVSMIIQPIPLCVGIVGSIPSRWF